MKKILISLFLLFAVIGFVFAQHTLVIGLLDSEGNEPIWSDLDWTVVRPIAPTQVLTPLTSLNTYWATAAETGMGFPMVGFQIEDFNNLGTPWAAGQQVDVYMEEISSGDYLNFSFVLTNGDPDIWDWNFIPITMTAPISMDPPMPTTLVTPADAAMDVMVDTMLEWNAAATATGYKVYFGMDNPPMTMVYDGVMMDYNPTVEFGKMYYWQVIPYNANGDAVACPVWSFTTEEYYDGTGGADIAGDIPEDVPAPVVDPAADPTGTTLDVNICYSININGGVTVTITLSHTLLASGILEHIGTGEVLGAVWDYVAGTVTFTWTFTPGKSEETFVIGEEPILAVEFASFTAATMATDDGVGVEVRWNTASETNMANFNVYRAEDNTFANATLLTSVTPNNHASEYRVTDLEVEDTYTYYYWVECVDLDGHLDLHGPVDVKVDEQLVHPIDRTVIGSAYPNPFVNGTSFDVAVKTGEVANITVYNILGQSVRNFKADHSQTINWDGTNENGKHCGSGIYFYRLTSPSNTVTKKVVIVK